jgi:uncharacterized protein DUF4340
MQQNRIKLLAGALVLLSAGAYFAGVFESEPTTIRVPEVDVPIDRVTSISLSSPNLSAELVRDGGVWRVAAPLSGRADSLVLGRLLDSVKEMTLLNVVSTNPDRHGRYGVSSETASIIKLSWDDGEATFQVAAQGPDFSSSYVRLEDAAEVYTASPRIAVPTSVEQLRDKTLANLQPVQVIEADVRTPDYSYRLKYGISGWTIAIDGAAEAPADSTVIAAWLRRFSPLRLDGFLDDWSPDSVEVSHTIRFAETTGATTQLFFGATGDTLAAHTGRSDAVLRTFVSRLTSLFEAPDRLTAGQ